MDLAAVLFSPSIGRHRLLMPRWSCSSRLLRYRLVRCRTCWPSSVRQRELHHEFAEVAGIISDYKGQQTYPAYNPCTFGGNVGSKGFRSSSMIVCNRSSDRRFSYVSLPDGYSDSSSMVGRALSMKLERLRSNWPRDNFDSTRPSTPS